MSWSLDPRRPNPQKRPEAWYRFWQEELEWSFSRPWECLVHDSDKFAFSEANFNFLQRMREQIASYRQDISLAYLSAYSKGRHLEVIWKGKGVDDRERILLQALVGMVSDDPPAEDYWQYCPDISKNALCSGEGEGLLTLMKHFITKDTVGKPSPNYPILKEPRVWRLFDLSDDATNASRPPAVQAQHQHVLVFRHYFLVSVVTRMLVDLLGLNVGTQYVRRMNTKAAEKKAKEIVNAGKDDRRLPDHVYDAMEKQMKNLAIHMKSKDPVDVCADCGKQTSHKMMCCGGCKKVGRNVTYCSKECQIHHYRHGEPPHKLSCSKPTPILPVTTEADDSDPFPLYTTTPSPDLLLQVHFIRRDNQQHDYYIMLPGGTPWLRDFPESLVKTIFLEARHKAMAEQDKTSIGVMYFILGPESAPQLEREYQVNIEECVKAAKDHKDWDQLKKYRIFTVAQDPPS